MLRSERGPSSPGVGSISTNIIYCLFITPDVMNTDPCWNHSKSGRCAGRVKVNRPVCGELGRKTAGERERGRDSPGPHNPAKLSTVQCATLSPHCR